MTKIIWPKVVKVTSNLLHFFCFRCIAFNFMTDKTIMETSKIISSLNRNGSIDMSRWDNLDKTCVHLLNVSASIQNVMYYITQAMIYLSKFFISHTKPIISFVIWPLVNFKFNNSWKKWIKRRTAIVRPLLSEKKFERDFF